MECYRVDMDRIVCISDEKLLYRNDKGEIDEVDLVQCRRRYIKHINSRLDDYPLRNGTPIAEDDASFRCVADRCISDAYPYFEFYDWPHIRFEIRMKSNYFTGLLDLMGWNWRKKYYDLFSRVRQQLIQAGWSSFDLS